MADPTSARPEPVEGPAKAGSGTHKMDRPAADLEDVAAKGEAPADTPEADAPTKPRHPAMELLAR